MDTNARAKSLSFEEILDIACADEDAAIASTTARADDVAAEVELAQLERPALPGAPSETQVSASAAALVIAFEVTSQSVYERRYRAPIWPHGASGVTIGIGYDLGYVDAATLEEDWGGSLEPSVISRLARACGVNGEAARDLVKDFADISVPWTEAEHVFRTRTLPLYTGTTERALPNTKLLNGDCLGALVSLVYNRGTSFRREGDRFREMRAIRDHMQSENFAAIPGELRAMRRLWQDVPNMAGLLRRREAEAALFERGLETMFAPSGVRANAIAEKAPPLRSIETAAAERGGGWLLGWLRSVVEEPTRDRVFAEIGPPAGRPETGVEIEPDTSYVALRVLAARIVNARRWTSRYHAAVHARCDMIYEGGTGRIERQAVLAPDGFRDIDPGGQGKLLQIDRPVFGPAPYRGDLRLSLGLFSVKSSDLAGPYLTLLSQLAETSALGFLKAAEAYVAPLRSAAELLFGTSGAADLECGVVRGFNPLRTGVWVSMGAPREQVPEPGRLRLDPSDFRLLWPDGRAVVDHPYVVFSVERASQREDWLAVPDLRDAWEAVRTAVHVRGDGTEARAALAAFRRVCLTSPDLIGSDAKRLVRRAEERFAFATQGAGSGELESPAPPTLALRRLGSFADLDLYGRRR